MPGTFLSLLISFPLQAAKLPMSIIIVGVGQAEFDGKNEDPFASLKFVTSDISLHKSLGLQAKTWDLQSCSHNCSQKKKKKDEFWGLDIH